MILSVRVMNLIILDTHWKVLFHSLCQQLFVQYVIGRLYIV